VLVFVCFQLSDERRQEQAIEYYLGSDLPRIELPRYIEYLRNSDKENKAGELKPPLESAQGTVYVLGLMESDEPFMRELHAGKIVR
jgi:hypothetical protein